LIRILLLSLIFVSCSSGLDEVITEFNPGDEIIGQHSIIDINENKKYSEWILDERVIGQITFGSVNMLFNGGTNGEFELNYILPGEDPLVDTSFSTIRVFFNWSYNEYLSRWNIELISGSFVDNLFNPRDPYYMIVTFSDGVYTMRPLPDQLYSDKLILYFK
tara:strand:+ start:169 stop:654 length:486 start_codon:yes stop_codon:yes gene_type:complete